MAIKKLKTRSQSGDQILTLTEWLEAHPDSRDDVFQIIRITKSQNYNGFNLRCKSNPEDFSIFLGEGDQRKGSLLEFVQTRQNPLYVKIDRQLGDWDFGVDDELFCHWYRCQDGWVCETVPERDSQNDIDSDRDTPTQLG